MTRLSMDVVVRLLVERGLSVVEHELGLDDLQPAATSGAERSAP